MIFVHKFYPTFCLTPILYAKFMNSNRHTDRYSESQTNRQRYSKTNIQTNRQSDRQFSLNDYRCECPVSSLSCNQYEAETAALSVLGGIAVNSGLRAQKQTLSLNDYRSECPVSSLSSKQYEVETAVLSVFGTTALHCGARGVITSVSSKLLQG